MKNTSLVRSAELGERRRALPKTFAFLLVGWLLFSPLDLYIAFVVSPSTSFAWLFTWRLIGAIPPLVGWAAVTGSLNITAVFLFAVVFYWTPPHFWALSLLIKNDYARANVPMLPVVQGDRQTRYQIVLYTVVLCLVTVLPLLTRSFGVVYLGGAAILDSVLLTDAVVASRRPTARSARRLFYHSMVYLALLFAVMAIDRVTGL